MNIVVSPPVLNPKTRAHVLQFHEAPTFSVSYSSVTELQRMSPERLEPLLSEFVPEFLRKASRYFSKPLEPSVFFQRVVHIWSGVGSVEGGASDHPLKAIWIPAEVHFLGAKYELVWRLESLEEEEKEESPVAAAEPAPQPSPPPDIQEVAPETIPFRERKVTAAEAAALRMKIRRARLRVAIAQLRAEKLAERYYAKYGTFEGTADGDSDSELSWASSEEDEAKAPRQPSASNGKI